MKRILPPLALLLVFAGFLFWWFQPANVVKRRVNAFLETAVVPENMSDLARSTRGPKIAEYLASSVEIRGPEQVANEVDGALARDHVTGIYSSVARYCRQISLEDPVFESISVADDKATVKLTLDALVELPDRSPVDGRQDVTMIWSKDDRAWKLSSISWTETRSR